MFDQQSQAAVASLRKYRGTAEYSRRLVSILPVITPYPLPPYERSVGTYDPANPIIVESGLHAFDTRFWKWHLFNPINKRNRRNSLPSFIPVHPSALKHLSQPDIEQNSTIGFEDQEASISTPILLDDDDSEHSNQSVPPRSPLTPTANNSDNDIDSEPLPSSEFYLEEQVKSEPQVESDSEEAEPELQSESDSEEDEPYRPDSDFEDDDYVQFDKKFSTTENKKSRKRKVAIEEGASNPPKRMRKSAPSGKNPSSKGRQSRGGKQPRNLHPAQQPHQPYKHSIQPLLNPVAQLIPQSTAVPTSVHQTATIIQQHSQPASNTTPARRRQPPWTQQEHQLLHQLIVARRQLEEDTDTKALFDMPFWDLMSQQLSQQYNITRTGTACKNYWCRHGREFYNIDERGRPHNAGKLSTCVQKPKAKKPKK